MRVERKKSTSSASRRFDSNKSVVGALRTDRTLCTSRPCDGGCLEATSSWSWSLPGASAGDRYVDDATGVGVSYPKPLTCRLPAETAIRKHLPCPRSSSTVAQNIELRARTCDIDLWIVAPPWHRAVTRVTIWGHDVKLRVVRARCSWVSRS